MAGRHPAAQADAVLEAAAGAAARDAGGCGQVAGGPAADRRAGDGGEAGDRRPQVRRVARRLRPPGRLLRRVTRDHCLAWAESLAEAPAEKTGKPLGAVSRIQRISGLSQMFRDTAAWEYADVPGYAPVTSRDAPKLPQRIPRFIAGHELALVMPVTS